MQPFNLQKGLRSGDTQHTECQLREPTAEDIIAASEESEKLVIVPGPNGPEPQLVTSPTLVGIHTLRRQIVRIGDINGPLERDMLGKLSPHDLHVIQQQAEALEKASQAVAQRGRTNSAGDGNAPGDQ